ncbi:hypothetical protein PoB_002515000 [Plakobranchus ocellatus]|uniref:Uncharacterized protein n=1 Tax=Plakobranchus ocellatus TaxID=259542 RepID=A0AAV3ZS71_9GAST|nr:hypothetical protein PoB_002515000 [Plakobranchus ocellatus]
MEVSEAGRCKRVATTSWNDGMAARVKNASPSTMRRLQFVTGDRNKRHYKAYFHNRPGDGNISGKNGVNDNVQEFEGAPSPSIVDNEDERPANNDKRINKKEKKVIGCMIQDVKGRPASVPHEFLRPPRRCYTNNVLHISFAKPSINS